MSIGKDNFCYRLKEERERLGLSQQLVAEKCSVSRVIWGKYERGETYPGGEVLLNFAEIGCDINYLMTGYRTGLDNKTCQDVTIYNRAEVDLIYKAFSHADDEGKKLILSLAEYINNKK